MMPLAPTPIVPVPSKPKIGFSIDSIVGGGGGGGGGGAGTGGGPGVQAGRVIEDRITGKDRLDHRVEIERDDGSPMELVEASSSPKSRGIATRSPGAHSEGSDRPVSRSSSVESYTNNPRRTPSHATTGNNNNNHHHHHHHHHHANHHGHHHHHHHHHLGGSNQLDFGKSTVLSHSGGSTPNDSPSPPHRIAGHGDSPVSSHPQPPPGVVRPSPNYLAPPPGAVTAAAAVAAEQLKSLYGIPPGHGPTAPQTGQNEYHSQQLALAANLAAAQHFQAANLAVALQAHHGASPHATPHGPYPHGGAPAGPHPPPHSHQPARDSYPLYPWLLSRHGRIFPHRFTAGPDISGFLLQPFRKPKRIRTAFSPSQLLKLEHAFEKNHYVVGAERKQLAQALSLTETQVKVWFQNRRTKHKRMQQEEEAKAQQQSGGGGGGGGGGGNGGAGGNANNNGNNKNTHHVSKWQQETGDYHHEDEEEEEQIDPEAEECSSDSEA